MVKEYRIPADLEVYNELDDCVWVCSYGPETSRFVWGNTAAVKVWGKETLEELQAKDISTGRSEAVKKIHEQLYSSLQVGGQVLRERRTLYPNKKAIVFDLVFKPINARITIENDQEIKEVVVLVHAVPLKDKGAQEANRSHEMLRHSPVLSMLFSSEGTLLGQNLSAKTFYEVTADDKNNATCDLNLSDVFSKCEFENAGQRDAMLAKCQKLRPGESSVQFECKKSQGDAGGAGRWHVLQCIPTYDPSTGSPALLINESDISQLQQLKKAHEEQEAAMQQQEQFFAAVSHELRTPLNGIIGLSESLFTDEDLEPTVVETMRVIHASGLRLSRLVNDILDAASLKHRSIQLKMETVSVEQVVETVCELTSTLAKPGVKLVNEMPTLPPVNGDFGRLTQIMTNLIGNALKFTIAGSVSVSGYHTGESVVVEVRDTGIGIPESKLDDIFVAFEQVDMSATRKFEGTGLGLSIVKSMVEAHGGSIGVTSSTLDHDHGSCFSVVLPVHKCQSPSGDESTAQILDEAAQADGSANRSPFSLGRCKAGGKKGGSTLDQLEEERRRVQQRLVDLTAEIEKLSAEDQGSGGRFANGSNAPVVFGNELAVKLLKASALQNQIASGDETGLPAVDGEIGQEGMEQQLQSLTVLTIDDNPVNQMMIQNVLRPHGFAVVCCKDGPEALTFLQQRTKPPDVILLDLMMPGMSGLDVVKEIRTVFPPLAVPVLMISAKSGDTYVEQGLGSGCNDYITKPFSTRELVARIKSQLKVRELLSKELQQLNNPEQQTSATEQQPTFCPAPSTDGQSCGLQIVDKFSDASVVMCQVVGLARKENMQHLQEHSEYITQIGNIFATACQAADVRRIEVSEFDMFMGVIGKSEECDEKQHADKAVSAATCMLSEMLQCRSALDTRLPVRIAIGSGEVFGGQRGANGRFTLVGDAVAKTRRLKDFCPSDCLLLANETLLQLSDKAAFDPFPLVQLPGGAGGSFKAQKAYIARLGPFEAEIAAAMAAHTTAPQPVPPPLAFVPEEGGPPIPFHSAVHGGREIMSIDDTHVNHMVLERIFTKESFVFTSCTSGIAALDRIRDRQYLPDCILLDVMMPEMSGIEVCSKIRELYGRQVPVLLISAKSDEDNILNGFQAGCDDYVTKPFKRKELVARVESRCRRPSPPRQHDAPPAAPFHQTLPAPPSRIASSASFTPSMDSTMTVDSRPKETLVCVQLADLSGDRALQDRLERAVQAVGDVAARHGLSMRSSPLAPLALMASTGSTPSLPQQATQAMRAAADMLSAVRGLPTPLLVRIGVLSVGDGGGGEQGDAESAVGAGAAAAAGLLLDGCEAGQVVVATSVMKVLDAEEFKLTPSGTALPVQGHETEGRHVWVGDGKQAAGTEGRGASSSEWAMCAVQVKAAALQRCAQQRTVETQEQQPRVGPSSTPPPPFDAPLPQRGGMRGGVGGEPLVIEDVPGDCDFIDRVSRCVVVHGLPALTSSTRRTMASVLSKFGTLQSQLELRTSARGTCLTVGEFDSEGAVAAAAKTLDGAVYNGAKLRAAALLPDV